MVSCSFGGGSSAKDYGSLENLFVGFVVLVVIVVLKHGTKRIYKLCINSDRYYRRICAGKYYGSSSSYTFTYVDDAGATVEATKSWVLNWDKVAAHPGCSAEDHACQMGI